MLISAFVSVCSSLKLAGSQEEPSQGKGHTLKPGHTSEGPIVESQRLIHRHNLCGPWVTDIPTCIWTTASWVGLKLYNQETTLVPARQIVLRCRAQRCYPCSWSQSGTVVLTDCHIRLYSTYYYGYCDTTNHWQHSSKYAQTQHSNHRCMFTASYCWYNMQFFWISVWWPQLYHYTVKVEHV